MSSSPPPASHAILLQKDCIIFHYEYQCLQGKKAAVVIAQTKGPTGTARGDIHCPAPLRQRVRTLLGRA
eukprot:1120044-Pyramimonas_sp.AAC.1